MASTRSKPQTKIDKIEQILLYPFQKGWFGIATAVLLVTFVILAGLSAVTNSAKPGEPAFVIDRAFEKVRVSTSISDTARFKHKVAIAEERLQELLEFNLEDVEGILGSLDELEFALLDVKADLGGPGELTEDEESASRAIDNLLDLITRYRAFLLGETENTEEIQEELDESVEEINNIVTIVNQSNPVILAQPVQPAASVPSPTTPSVSIKPSPVDDNCPTYENLGGEVEYDDVILQKNVCGEYTGKIGGTTYVLITNDNLDYAISQEVKFHGSPGTDNSIFLTEFEIDD